MFTANVGTPDRIIRLVLGAILIALPFLVPSLAAAPWLYLLPGVGLVLAVTAFVAWCPIYAALKLSTRPRKSA